MLTVDRCRALIGDYSSSDESIIVLRSALYSIAELAFEVYSNDTQSGSKNPLGLLSADNSDDMF